MPDPGVQGTRLSGVRLGGEGTGRTWAPQGTFGNVQVEANLRALVLEDGDGLRKNVDGANQVAIVEVPAIEAEGWWETFQEGVEREGEEEGAERVERAERV